MSNVGLESKIEGLGSIYYCTDSFFDVAYKTILEKSNGIISARDLAYARIVDGRDSSVSTNGSYVREGSLFVAKSEDNRRILLRESLVLQNPNDAVNAHRISNEYLLPPSFDVDKYLESIGKDNYFVLENTNPIPTGRFGEDERTVFLFQDMAKEYGKFLMYTGISKFSIYMYNGDDKHIDKQFGPFANQLWLSALGDSSGISGDLRYLDNFSQVRVSRVRGLHRDVKAKKNIVPNNASLVDPWSIDIPTIENKVMSK